MLQHWWLSSFDRLWEKAPALLQIVVVLWVLLGLLVAIIPDLQHMPDAIRFAIGFPAAIGILWMGTGALLTVVDKVMAIVTYAKRRIAGTR
jgi:hypothetical protein